MVKPTIHSYYSRLKYSSLCYISSSKNIYYNLAFEEWLLRNTASDLPVLFLYTNSPCIVIGRNQNPWLECNTRAAHQNGIRIARRHSGGGTVYHDLGNMNYTLFTSKEKFSRTFALDMIIDSFKLESNSINVVKSQYHDLLINDQSECLKKISGSAYRVISNRAYHHGTMLIHAQLDVLNNLLVPAIPSKFVNSKASLPSRKSLVANIKDVEPTFTQPKFIQNITRTFFDLFGQGQVIHVNPERSNSDDSSKAQDYYLELNSWNWIFGKTPSFEVRLAFLSLKFNETSYMTVKEGKIQNFKLSSNDIQYKSEVDPLVGLAFDDILN